jgi:hypothetical protein
VTLQDLLTLHVLFTLFYFQSSTISVIQNEIMLCFLKKHLPGWTDLFAKAVSLLWHQTGMGSHKKISFASVTRSEVYYTT